MICCLLGQAQGLYYSDDGTTFQQLSTPGNTNIKSLSIGSNSLLINSQSGLFTLDVNSSLSTIYSGSNVFNDAADYTDGVIFAATSTGLDSIATTNSFKNYLPPGPAINTISNLSVDESGNLWCSVSIYDFGVAFMKYDYATGTWKNYSVAQDTILRSNACYAVSAVSGDRVVAGTWGGGMALLRGDSIMGVFDHSNTPQLVGFSKDTNFVLVGSAVSDQSGNIWMVNKGAYNDNVLDVDSTNGHWGTVTDDNTSDDGGFSVLAIDAYGGLWVGDAYNDVNPQGLFYFNPAYNLQESFTTNDGLLGNRVYAILVDSENQLWIGTSGGLNVDYDPYIAKQSDFSALSIYSMLDENVTGIDYDALDDKWVSTSTGVFDCPRMAILDCRNMI